MRKIIILMLCFGLLSFFSCKKNDAKLIDKETGKEITIEIKRFENVLFNSNQKDFKKYLQENYEEYKPLFNTTLDNPAYISMIEDFVSDPELKYTYGVVKYRYPNLDWLSKDITSAFARLTKEYPDLQIPTVYSLIFGPADFGYTYSKKVIAEKDFIAFSIDLYTLDTLSKSKYYSNFPKYMVQMLDSNNIVPDIMMAYLKNVATVDIPLVESNPTASLCELIIEHGKYLYALKEILPNYSDNSIFRYNEDQMKWTKGNEDKIWGYIVQNNLLFEKDRTKYFHLVADGPSSKGIDGSAPRIADYIGYKIVAKYMNENKISLKELFAIKDANQILKQSGYKPKK